MLPQRGDGAVFATTKVAAVVVDGITRVIESWGENPPPRAGRPPSIEELLREAVVGPKPPKRVIPGAVHRGRPRKTPCTAAGRVG
jgi:hypothetical protein